MIRLRRGALRPPNRVSHLPPQGGSAYQNNPGAGGCDSLRNAAPGAAEKQHPAKRSFQAIRIAVNDELGSVEKAMKDAIPLLNPRGRLAVITFHSLEDRIVKNAMAEAAKGCTCPPSFPVCVCGKKPLVKLVSRKPIVASDEELEANPRSRSAKLRVCEKI